MDIVLDKQKENKFQKYKWAIGIILVLFLVGLFFFSQPQSQAFIDKETTVVGVVQQGDFEVSVRGSGTLVAKDVRWLVARVDGRVNRLLIEAGAKVKKGELLLELSNPDLEQELEEMTWELESLEAETKAKKADLEFKLLNQEVAIVLAKLNYEKTKVTFNSNSKLADQNKGAVSSIELDNLKILMEQDKQRWNIEQKRFEKSKINFDAQIASFDAKLKKMRRAIERNRNKFSELQVRASMDSIIQEVPLELGQQIRSGENLAKLARHDLLIAELSIPEIQFNDITIGQQALIDIRNKKIQGEVIRVAPGVVNGMIKVDISLTNQQPVALRPGLNVSGIIKIDNIKNALYVKRPVNVRTNSQTSIFKISMDESYAEKVVVDFGTGTSSLIQIKNGLKSLDKIILSNDPDWSNLDRVKIK